MSAKHDSPGKPKVLIVDDDPMTCRLVKLQLEMEGYVCKTLSDPERVLEVIADDLPELVLVDFHLGTQGGLELLQSIHSREEYEHLPVVVMSATDYQRESELAGANGFVLKPFNWEDITTTIQEVLDRQKE